MSRTEGIDEEFLGEDLKIPIKDKRRFSADGERTAADVVVEPEPAVANVSPREAELELQLKAETERREAAESKLVGVQAKFEEVKAGLEKETSEMRERMRRSLEDRAKQSQFKFLTELLPVLDNLNLAVSASETDSSLENLRNGVVGTARSFEHALANVGVVAVPSVGVAFDPEVHEAIDMAEVDAEQDGTVISEYQRGYRFGEQLLRPAKVQVGRGRAKPAGE